MCGRYSLYSKEEIFNNFNILITPNYNISPGNNILVLNNKLRAEYMYWGIKYNWLNKKLIANARLETVQNKSFYNDYKRCIIIADGYIEWKKEKKNNEPYYHYLNDSLVYMAGLYKNSNAVIITIDSYDKISHIHMRQPLIINKQHLKSWVIEKKINSITEHNIQYYKISNAVNNIKSNYKNLLLKKN